MRKLMLFAGVAALAASMPALADAQERGRGGGKGQSAEAQSKGGGQARAERGRGRDRQEARGGERRGRDAARAERRGGGDNRSERRAGRDRDRVEKAIRAERRQVRDARREARAERRERDEPRALRPARQVREARRDDRRDWRGWTERRADMRDRFGDDLVRLRSDRGRALAVGPQGCPPGLARQNAFCMPPGQLRKSQLIGQRLPLARLSYNVPERYRYRFADDGRYFYRWGDDRTIYRFDRSSGLVSAVFPVVSNGLYLGEPLPLGYDVYNVPFAYRQYYPDTSDYFYRYDNSAIYRVDSGSMLVDGIVALLTGGVGGLGGLGVGDRLPAGYDVYNVPFDYRDTYYDTDEWMYRYADGSVYRVDPTTRLIEAVISLLV